MPEIRISENIPTRDELINWFGGTGVELGVAAGEYSEKILQNPNVQRLYSIDRWANDGKHNDREFLSVLKRFEKYKERSIIIRRTFEQASVMFPAATFDFVYVDGYAHTGQEGGKTFDEWWSKLKPGGVFAGHDYHRRWQPTIDAVNSFVDRLNLPLYVTEEYDDTIYVYPSWYVFKPE